MQSDLYLAFIIITVIIIIIRPMGLAILLIFWWWNHKSNGSLVYFNLKRSIARWLGHVQL